jgi:hypothetical protein
VNGSASIGPDCLDDTTSVVVVALAFVLAVTGLALALRARRYASSGHAIADARRGAERRVGPAILSGIVWSDDESPVIRVRAGRGTSSNELVGRLLGASVVARPFWLSTRDGPIAVDPEPGTFLFDFDVEQVYFDEGPPLSHARFARPERPVAADGSKLRSANLRSGDRVEIAGWLRRERMPEMSGGDYREAAEGWVIAGRPEMKLLISTRGLDFVSRERVRAWTWSLVVSGLVVLFAASHLFVIRLRRSECLQAVPDVPVVAGWLLLFFAPLAYARACDRERDWLSARDQER